MYRVTYRNPNNVIHTEPRVLETRSKAQVREQVAMSRLYPGSCEILEITKVTKAHGTETLNAYDF